MSPDLIFDVGMHRGSDTEFYLKKGFRVVAIDANPSLCEAAKLKFASFIENRRLTIYNCGIAAEEGTLDFIINLSSDDWSSFDLYHGQRGGAFRTVPVECRTLSSILDEFGEVPYYLKIDIEGYDGLCLDALTGRTSVPKFVSTEATVSDFLERMQPLGYRRFKIISQAWHQWLKLPVPSREGNYVEQQMTGHHSGPFGDETYGPWLSAEEFRAELKLVTTKQFAGSLHQKLGCPEILWDNSWWDFHASL